MSPRSKLTGWEFSRVLFLLIAFLIALVLLASWQIHLIEAAAEPDPFSTVTFPENALAAPPKLRISPAVIPLGGDKLDSTLSELTKISEETAAEIESFTQTADLKLVEDRVQTRVITTPDGLRRAEKSIQEAGGIVTYSSDLDPELQAWIPVEALETVAKEPSIRLISKPAYAVPMDTYSLDALTEGLVPLNASAWHNAGKKGAGVKIAVIDSGFIGYAGLLGFDLPNSVTVKNFVDGESDGQVGTFSNHGTACAEIIYDIAPDAQFYLIKIATNLDLQQAVNYAISQGVDVISTSIGWYNLTPGDGTGQFSNLVNLATNNNIIWLTAAGNDRDAHWGGAYDSGGDDNFHNFTHTQEVNYFGPGDGSGYGLPAGTLLRVYLRWDDWTAVNQDYALHIVAWNAQFGQWQIVATSDRPQNGGAGQRPTEDIFGYTAGLTKPYGFIIERIGGGRNVNFEIFAPDVAPLDEFVPDRSLPNLADAPAVVTIGAVGAGWPYSFQDYSAQGPTNGPGGTAEGGIAKPNLVGYTGVSTESYGFQGFGGTSASAPHAAGAAALLRGVHPTYSPLLIRNIMQQKAIDMGPPGLDMMFGHGRLFLGDPPNPPVGLDEHVYMPVALK